MALITAFTRGTTFQSKIGSQSSLENLANGAKEISDIQHLVDKALQDALSSNTTDKVIETLKQMQTDLQLMQENVAEYSNVSLSENVDVESLIAVGAKLEETVYHVLGAARQLSETQNTTLASNFKRLNDALASLFSSQAFRYINYVYANINDKLLGIGQNIKSMRDVLLSSISSSREVVDYAARSHTLTQSLIDRLKRKSESNSLASASKTITNIYDTVRRTAAFTAQQLNGDVNVDILRDVYDARDLCEQVRKKRHSSSYADYIDALRGLSDVGKQALIKLGKNAEGFNADAFPSTYNFVNVLGREIELADKIITTYSQSTDDDIKSKVEDFDIKDIVNQIHQHQRQRAEADAKNITRENIMNDQATTNRIATRWLNFKPHNDVTLANAYINRGTPSSLFYLNRFDNGFGDKLSHYRHVVEVGKNVDAEAASKASIPFPDKDRDSNMIGLRGHKYTSLFNINDAILDVSKSIIRKDTRTATKDDATVIEETRKNIVTAIENTRKAIQAESLIDPHSEYIKKLKEQLKNLEEEEASYADSSIPFDTFKESFLQFFSAIQTGFEMMGLGGLLSVGSFGRDIQRHYEENGRLIARDMWASNARGSMDARGAYQRVLGMGADYFAATYGESAIGGPSEMFRTFSKNVYGLRGNSPSQTINDLGYFTQHMYAPSLLYGIDAGTIGDALSEMQYGQNMSAQEAVQATYGMIRAAQQSNVPITRYMKAITSLSGAFRGIGFSSKNVTSLMSTMMNRGMRLDDAQELISDIGKAENSFGQNKANSIYSIFSGLDTNMWSAMLNNSLSHDMYGNPIEGRMERLGTQMGNKFGMFMDMFGTNQTMRAYMMWDVTGQEGMNGKTRSILTSMVLEGREEDIQNYLKGNTPNEADKEINETKELNNFNTELIKSSDRLSEIQKIKNTRDVAANRLASLLHTKYKGEMAELGSAMRGAIAEYGLTFANIIRKLGQLLNTPMVHDGLMWASQNPFTAMALGLTGYSLAKTGVKAAGRFVWNKATSWISSKGVDLAETAAKNSSSSRWSGLGKSLKNLGRSLKGAKGKVALGAALATAAGVYLASQDWSDDKKAQDKAKDDDEERLANMLSEGTGKVQLVDENKRPVADKYTDNIPTTQPQETEDNSKWVIGGLSALGLSVPFIASSNASLPSAIKNVVNKGIRGKVGVGIAVAGGLIYGATQLANANPANDEDEQDDNLANPNLPIQQNQPKKQQNNDDKPNPNDTLASGAITQTREQETINENMYAYLDKITADTDMYGHSINDLIQSDTKRGEELKQFLKDNKLDYDKLNDTEKQIFKHMMDLMKEAHLKLSEVLSVANIHIANYRNQISKARKNKDGKYIKLTDAKEKEIAEEAAKYFSKDEKKRLEQYLEHIKIAKQLSQESDEQKRITIPKNLEDKINKIEQLKLTNDIADAEGFNDSAKEYLNNDKDLEQFLINVRIAQKTNEAFDKEEGVELAKTSVQDYMMDENASAEAIYVYLRKLGYSPTAAAGIMGNISAESSFDPTSQGGNNNGHFGLFQWASAISENGTRWERLVEWARANGKNEFDYRTQLEYMMIEEGQDVTPETMNQFATPEEASAYFHKYFERSLGEADIERQEEARKAFNTYSGMQGDFTPVNISSRRSQTTQQQRVTAPPPKPATIQEQFQSNLASYQATMRGIGLDGGGTQGRIMYGMYVDNSKPYQSVDDIRRQNIINQMSAENYEQSMRESVNKAVEMSANDMSELMQSTYGIAEEVAQKFLEKDEEESIAVMKILGMLKPDKSYDEMMAKLKEILSQFSDVHLQLAESGL